MMQVLGSAWALLLGLMLLMVGNGLQGTLLGVRGQIEGFTTFEMSIVMSGYFLGFLGGSRAAPEMIRRVGHVRVFAALGSFISAILILYPTIAHPVAWTIGRICIGFCFSGVYVTAESWLNNAATNENRGKALSLYMLVQVLGIIMAQGLLLVADPAGFVLFVIPSVLVSIAFAPILLSVQPTPAFERTAPMNLRQLFRVSPLACVGVFILGGAFSAQFGMAAVYGGQAGLTLVQISTFIAMFYIGATLFQFPVGWISDRMDRRRLIMIVSAVGTGGAIVGALFGSFYGILVAAFFLGGMSNPLYSLLISHANDFLEPSEMASVSGGMLFLNGLGAISGPLATGWLMTAFGPSGFWIFNAVLLALLTGYALYRMTQRPAPKTDDTGSYAPVLMSATPVALEAAQEWAVEAAENEENDTPPA
ncbi:MFS transporter [Primorskyibacter flagellatus]|uniref:MFS transporter n=1 Tax=Primorskyibacter flagellatus TaxID=1387277 RepID=A0A917A5D7_9RHOB|nr:MFS transporter [Primorskyibacter flagellatus]GGE28618.1 MFS transporter [Primorskyibacter flagellatus]